MLFLLWEVQESCFHWQEQNIIWVFVKVEILEKSLAQGVIVFLFNYCDLAFGSNQLKKQKHISY